MVWNDIWNAGNLMKFVEMRFLIWIQSRFCRSNGQTATSPEVQWREMIIADPIRFKSWSFCAALTVEAPPRAKRRNAVALENSRLDEKLDEIYVIWMKYEWNTDSVKTCLTEEHVSTCHVWSSLIKFDHVWCLSYHFISIYLHPFNV